MERAGSELAQDVAERDASASVLSAADVMVPAPAVGIVVDPRAWVPGAAGFEIEIGCGKGGFLLHQARAHPNVLFLGIEWASKYYRFTADRMARWQITNVRVMRTDARLLVERSLPHGSVNALHVYHPDPWPKKRHHKRRLFQPPFVDAVARVLVTGGRLLVQTDHEEYFRWIETVVGGQAALLRTFGEDERAQGAIEAAPATNFEVKYRREGRAIYRASWCRAAD